MNAMAEPTHGAMDGPASLAGGVPLTAFTFAIAGRTWTIRAVRDQGALLSACDAFTEFPFGLLLWESAPALAEALVADAKPLRGTSVLEIGAGAGLVGLVAASLGARVRQVDHSAAAVDLARANAADNAISGIDTLTADWNDWRDPQHYDLILGSDILYDRESFAPLLAIFERNVAPGGRVLLSDPVRGDTPKFLAIVRLAGWSVAMRRVEIPAVVPANGRTQVPVDLIELARG